MNPGRTVPTSSRWALALIALFFMTAMAGQALRPLTDRTEARYAEVAREMVASGDWFIPTLDQAPRLSKPPLTTWFMAASMSLFGVNEAAARLPGVLALFGMICLVARLAALWSRPDYAPWAAVLFGSSLAPLVGAVYPSTDTLLALFETASATAYVMHQMGYPRARWWFFICLGAAFLTKGPPGLLVPASVIVGDRLLRKNAQRSPSTRSLLLWVPGWLCFAAVGAAWYVAVAIARPSTVGYWLHDEVVGRIFTTRHGRNQSPLVYLLTLVLGTFPWWFFYKQGLGSKRFLGAWREGWRPLLLSWFAIPLVVFVCSKSRLPAYLLPLFPALALLVALEAPRRWSETPGRWFGIRPVYLVGYSAVLAALSVASIPWSQASSWKQEGTGLRAKLEGQEYELLLLSPGDAASLEFYLAPKRITIIDPGVAFNESHDLAAEPHLIFAHQARVPAVHTDRGPVFLDFKNHCSLWLSPGAPKAAS